MVTPRQRRRVQVQDNTLYGPTGQPLVPSPGLAGNLNQGGIVNEAAGMGGAGDKSQHSFFWPTRFYARYPLEILYVQSWVAAHFVDIPVDDMFAKGRAWESDDEEAIKAAQDVCLELMIDERLSQAMKAARLYGTGLAVMMTNEATAESPLNPEMVKEGDFTNLLVFDRFASTVKTMVKDPYDMQFGQPELYEFTSSLIDGPLTVHHSRVLRFDGRKALTSEGWTGFYDREWGISELIYAITEIMHDAGLANNISQLSYEASIPVIKSEGFRDAVSGMVGPDDPSVMEQASQINLYKSLYRIMFMDVNDNFERVAVTFAGLSDLMQQFWARLAAIAGIPATRFLGRSPEGMNASGDSDADNYALHVASMQERLLARPLKRLDMVLARHMGLAEPMDYTWRPLTDWSEKDQAEINYKNAEALGMLYDRNSLTEDEYRERLNHLALFEGLGPMPELDEDAERRRGIMPEPQPGGEPMPGEEGGEGGGGNEPPDQT